MEPIPGLGEKVRIQRRLLKTLIFYGGMITWFFLLFSPPLVESHTFPFIGSRGDRDARGCLRGEVLSSAVEVAVATCPGNGRPSLDTMVT
jgi:hypothetical protein